MVSLRVIVAGELGMLQNNRISSDYSAHNVLYNILCRANTAQQDFCKKIVQCQSHLTDFGHSSSLNSLCFLPPLARPVSNLKLTTKTLKKSRYIKLHLKWSHSLKTIYYLFVRWIVSNTSPVNSKHEFFFLKFLLTHENNSETKPPFKTIYSIWSCLFKMCLWS